MRLLIVWILILFTHITQAALTIKPIDNDHSSFLIRCNQEKIITNHGSKKNSIGIKNKTCNYNINYFCYIPNCETDCAVNTNIKKSTKNGDICN